MIPRRVVTNINTIGKAILQSDGVPPWSKEMVHTPGFASSFIWATSPAPKIPTSGDDPTDTATSIVPGPGETRFLVVTFPPDSVFADPAIDFAKANQEQAEESPVSSNYSSPIIRVCTQRPRSTMASYSTAKFGSNSTTARPFI